MSLGQKIGHIMGCPKRLICRQPPASVASLVAHHTPVRAPGRSCGCWWETSRTMESTWVLAKLFCRVLRPPRRQVRRGPVCHRPVDHGEQRQVDVERVTDASGPDTGVAPAGRLAGPALQHEFAVCGVFARLAAGKRMQLQGLPPARVGFTERHPVGQGLEVRSVEVHLELIARLRVEPRLGKQAVDVGVDVHDEHRAALAREDVQVIDVELAGLACERRVEMMGHAKFLLARTTGAVWVGRSGSA